VSVSSPLSARTAVGYVRHRPEQTVLYQLIEEHYPAFVSTLEASGGHLPSFVRQEFEEYLKCGLLEHGFLRVKCDGCLHEHLVAFSCKRRGFCPSCGARRMVESAAHLVDHVIPEVPVRQFVLTFPFPLRFLLAAEPRALTEVLAVVQRGISTFLIRRAGFAVSSGAKTGSVTLIQRFGSALNLNPHLHMLFLDGAYTFKGIKASFHRARRPLPDELVNLLGSLRCRIARLPWISFRPPPSSTVLPWAPMQDAKRSLSTASRRWTIQRVPACWPRWTAFPCKAYQRSKLERLCRYITRPPIATKRLSLDRQGRVIYQYKRPFRDGSTHVVLEPLDFMARLAALVPRPRLNLTRFHGVFAPNFKHRARIVPHRPRGKVDNGKPTAPMSWMQRLKRVFAIDIETCPHCGGKLRVIACIEDPALIRHILMHIERRKALINRAARAPPDAQKTLLPI